MKKKTEKKIHSKKAVPKTKNFKTFEEWWDKVAQKKVEKIEKRWLKENEPNDPDDDGGGDHWHVNQMMHDGDAFNMTYDASEKAWNTAITGGEWEMNQSDSLYCELDGIIVEAYETAKSIQNKGDNQ
jgi:hypothetical protein